MIGFTRTFHLLKLESHTAEHLLKDAFSTLLRADFYSEGEGAFHSAFFNLTIGVERLLKIALISNELVTAKNASPKPGYMKSAFSHNLSKTYAACISLVESRGVKTESLSQLQNEILYFLTEYAKGERYFHLNQLEAPSREKDPVTNLQSILRNLHESRIGYDRANLLFLKLLQRLDNANIPNTYTYFTDSSGHPMTVAEIEHVRLMWKMNKKYLVLAIMRCLQPIRELLNMLSAEAIVMEIEMGMKEMNIPDYADFFGFLEVDKESDIKNGLWRH
jgi:hypothetical protein